MIATTDALAAAASGATPGRQERLVLLDYLLPVQIECIGRPAAPLAAPLGQVDHVGAVGPGATPLARRPGPGQGPQRCVLAEPADDRHAQGLRRLEEGHVGIGPVGDHPDRQPQEIQPGLDPSEQLDGQFQLGAELRPMLRVEARQVFLADVEPGQQRKGDHSPGWVGHEQGQDDEDVPVDVGRAGRAGGRVVVDACPLDVRPVPLGRRVVQGEGQPRGPLEQRPDHVEQQASGDDVGLLPGGGHGDVAGLEPIAELGRPDPGRDGAPAPGQDGAEEQTGEPGSGPAVEDRCEPGEPLAWGG